VDQLHTELQFLQQSLQEAVQLADRHAIEVYERRIASVQVQILDEMHIMEHEKKTNTFEQTISDARGEERKKFQEIRASIPIRFIETQRLLNATKVTESKRLERHPIMRPTVTLYSEELSETLNAQLADSTTLTQELDRTFPRRLVDLASRQSDISESELRAKLDELEAKRKSLMSVGLIDQNPNDSVLATNRIDASTKTVLSLYIEDSRQKLAVFDDIAPKIELLTRIINKRFLYKEMSISRKDGFVFTTSRGARLPLEKLSSGEQHELILFYELLFKTSPGSLIMIDEPEISLHVVWQEQFLQDVQDITRLANVDVLIATHSPDIIDGHRDLVVELEGPEDGGL
jgi:predicted ATP-binding protein involved in virulence